MCFLAKETGLCVELASIPFVKLQHAPRERKRLKDSNFGLKFCIQVLPSEGQQTIILKIHTDTSNVSLNFTSHSSIQHKSPWPYIKNFAVCSCSITVTNV